jgi:hypothetical protein
MPACFSMLLSVPIGISRTGCGTVTRPVFTGCLNCLWLPTCATTYQPSCFKRCMTSRLDIRYDTHFLHTCQVGVYKSAMGFFDTADNYTEGESEKILGQSLKNLSIARKDVVIATKVYSRVGGTARWATWLECGNSHFPRNN